MYTETVYIYPGWAAWRLLTLLPGAVCKAVNSRRGRLLLTFAVCKVVNSRDGSLLVTFAVCKAVNPRDGSQLLPGAVCKVVNPRDCRQLKHPPRGESWVSAHSANVYI